MNLDNLTKMIGSIVASVVLMSIPILCVCSLMFDWHGFLSGILIWGVLAETASLSMVIYVKGGGQI